MSEKRCYAIAEIDVTDPGWVQEYVEKVTPLVEARGGRYLARTGRLEKIEGERERPQTVLIIEWPSRQRALEFYESEEYRPYREARINGSASEFLLVDAEDMTGAAKIPP